MLLALFTIACAAGVAWANGSNDVSKGVATLVGSRLATYRQGLSWGAGWTVAGAVAALLFTAVLLRTFSTGLVTGEVANSPLFPLSVATGAFTWVLFATRTGLAVSTTHSLAGVRRPRCAMEHRVESCRGLGHHAAGLGRCFSRDVVVGQSPLTSPRCLELRFPLIP